MTQTDWNETHNIFFFYSASAGEYFVCVATGYMHVEDFIGGGVILAPFQVPNDFAKVGRFTNAEILNGKYLTQKS